ncbi:MAG TPA: TIGR00282 family metallophosphoesterase [Candidatus Saccharimonadales bacterium]|nr:TIGR00282 family metallophosphoesterase [Candidatus Saccharimonadales bacterium]
MRILYLGDIYAEPGLKVVDLLLKKIKKKHQVDVVIAQVENVTDGRGINVRDYERLIKAGVDFCTGGNWSLAQPDIIPSLNDPNSPIIRPANYPDPTPGMGYKYLKTNGGKILVVSLLGAVVGRDSSKPIDNPLIKIDQILKAESRKPKVATVVNFHGDYSSEKYVIGYYLDGKVSAVIGDHWHIPTADAAVLPKGTAHITDVGMCGTIESSIGVKTDIIIKRWRDNQILRNAPEDMGPLQFNALLFEVDPKTGLSTKAELVQEKILT